MARVTYKPNVVIEVRPTNDVVSTYRDLPAVIVVKMYVPDSRRTQPPVSFEWIDRSMRWTDGELDSRRITHDVELIEVAGFYHVPPYLTEVEFYGWLRSILKSLEMHEFDEWYRVDGEIANDPHNRRMRE